MADVTIADLNPAAAATGAMKLEVDDAAAPKYVTVNQMQDAVIGTTNGLIARTAANTTAARSIAVTSSGGIAVSNGDGVSGNPTIALDGSLESLAGISLAQGDLLYATGADALARLPKGTANQQLLMNSGATAPVWATPALALLSTTTISSGATSVFYNLNYVPAYQEFELHFQNVAPATDNDTLAVRLSYNSTELVTAGDYRGTVLNSTATTTASTASNTAYVNLTPAGAVGNQTGEVGASGELRIWPGVYYCMLKSDLVYMNGSTVVSRAIAHGQSTRSTGLAVNGIRIYFVTGNMSGGTIALYGVNRS